MPVRLGYLHCGGEARCNRVYTEYRMILETARPSVENMVMRSADDGCVALSTTFCDADYIIVGSINSY